MDPERERFRVQAALVDALVAVADEAGLLFIIEDLHWASEATRGSSRYRSLGPPSSARRGRDDSRRPGQDRYAALLGRLARRRA